MFCKTKVKAFYFSFFFSSSSSMEVIKVKALERRKRAWQKNWNFFSFRSSLRETSFYLQFIRSLFPCLIGNSGCKKYWDEKVYKIRSSSMKEDGSLLRIFSSLTINWKLFLYYIRVFFSSSSSSSSFIAFILHGSVYIENK